MARQLILRGMVTSGAQGMQVEQRLSEVFFAQVSMRIAWQIILLRQVQRGRQ